MAIVLSEIDARVLGSLIEKEITTPEYYPLSLNALVNACNQKSSREPVMSISEDQAREALHALAEVGLAQSSRLESRVMKYEHRLQEVFNFSRQETAVLCVLLLRGAQTPGELRGRTERLYHFVELTDVQSALQKLMQREPPLAKVLPRQPGTKEARYAHLLCGEDGEVFTSGNTSQDDGVSTDGDRIVRLENQIASLEEEVAGLKMDLAAFKKKFE